MIDLVITLVLLFQNQQGIYTLQFPGIISNESFYIEEYGTVRFDCFIEEDLLAAWRIRLRHDEIYR